MQSDAWAVEWQTCTGDFGIDNGASGELVKKLGNASNAQIHYKVEPR